MDAVLQDEKKICRYCKKEFTITADEQDEALKKGVEIKREYCNECLIKWRKGEINLEK